MINLLIHTATTAHNHYVAAIQAKDWDRADTYRVYCMKAVKALEARGYYTHY
jgi:fumarate reductase subunit C